MDSTISFAINGNPCGKILLCKQGTDICFIKGPISTEWEEVEVTAPDESATVTLKGHTLSIAEVREGELVLEWADWIERGMSGSGIYQGDKLVAILSRIKRGEYAVGILVAPYQS
jgi:hypothetical protein